MYLVSASAEIGLSASVLEFFHCFPFVLFLVPIFLSFIATNFQINTIRKKNSNLKNFLSWVCSAKSVCWPWGACVF